MNKELTGGCCCGAVSFAVEDNFSHFYFCHCEQCRKLTGSAHASNLFTEPDNIRWIAGQDKIKRFIHPTRSFSKNFCLVCGSALPFLSQSGRYLLVPAGSLNTEPTKRVDAQIFCSEQTQWHKSGIKAIKVDKFL
ncbi:GFA family protein [Psychromonas sp. MME2]|uniref:GFA family protein n=1 Tax=unclassified Psychromonas TaxID=2614957 RepID=UPI00339C37ED